jgi:hypothetical protein
MIINPALQLAVPNVTLAVLNITLAVPNVTLHSGSSLAVIIFFHFFFVLYINLNLSDDVFEEKKIFFP